MTKRILALLLSICLICALGITAFAADGDVVILHTNDVHTYIDGDLSYANVAQMKQDLGAILVDAGDHLQGTAYGAMDNGATIVELMNAAGYDVSAVGNHEFDYGMTRALEVLTGTEATYSYVSCNFMDLVAGKTVLDSYKIVENNGKKIAFVGITTPETYTKSAPAYFQDSEGNWIYGITGAGTTNTQDLYDAVQAAINAAAAEADYVIALGHLGVDETSAPWRSIDVIANVSGLTAFIDGHSHTKIELNNMVKDKDGNDVLLAQTGDYLSAVGKITIAADGTVSNELITGYEAFDETVDTIAKDWIKEVDNKLNVVIAETEIEFTISGENGKRQIRVDETNLGDLSPDAYYYYINMIEELNCDVAIMNGGGIRATIAAGDWTYNSAKTVHPFGNVLCLMEVTGQVILDALEWGAKSTNFTAGDRENGGFLHVAGITYDINPHIASTVQIDEAGLWAGKPTGDYRVTNVQVYNKETKAYEPLELDKKYSLAGTNYTLRNCGDGFNMFGEAVLLKDYIAEDYLALSAYLMAFADTDADEIANIATANSPLKAYENYKINYEDLYEGAKRINETGACTGYDVSGSNSESHWHECICGEIDATTVETHELGTEYGYDEKDHWLSCECGYDAKEAHTLDWFVDKEADKGIKGSGHYECSVCDYVSDAVVIPALPNPCEHEFDENGLCGLCGIVVIDHSGASKPADGETNPSTGAPVFGVAILVAAGVLASRKK